MAGDPRDLSHLARKGFDLMVFCVPCHKRKRRIEPVVIPVSVVIELFRAMRWNQTWQIAPSRFRCRLCGQKAAVFGYLEKGSAPTPCPVTELRPPPKGIRARDWYGASEAERRRLANMVRS